MCKSIFITGTDTGVGKTFFTSGIVAKLRELGVDVVGFKPIECGGRSDSQALLAASGDAHTLDELNPIWLEKPLAPLAAADSPEDLPLETITKAHKNLTGQHDLVLVEGAGGWLAPVTTEITMADLAAEMCDEVILVAANKLGVVNHTLLTLRAIWERQLDCSKVILNHLPAANQDEGDLSSTTNSKTISECLPSVEIFSLQSAYCFGGLAATVFPNREIKN